MAREVNAVMPTSGYKSIRKRFSDEQEKLIAKYSITVGDKYYELTPIDARVLAYQSAARFNVKFLHQRLTLAGEDWLSGFILRNPVLSKRDTRSKELGQSHKF